MFLRIGLVPKRKEKKIIYKVCLMGLQFSNRNTTCHTEQLVSIAQLVPGFVSCLLQA